MKRVHPVLGLIAVVLCVTLAGCGGNATSMSSRAKASSRTVQGVTFTLSTDKTTYRAGEPLTISFSVTNNTESLVVFGVGTCNMFDAHIDGPGNPGDPFANGGCAPSGRDITIYSGETVGFSQTLTGGLVSGSYTITGWFNGISSFASAFSGGNQQSAEYAGPVAVTVIGR